MPTLVLKCPRGTPAITRAQPHHKSHSDFTLRPTEDSGESALWWQWILLESSSPCSEVKECYAGASLMQSQSSQQGTIAPRSKMRLLCFLSHFQWCNVKSAGKLSIKTLAEGMCQSLFITYSLSMRAMTRSVWLSKQQLRDIRADEASVQTEMTTFWQLKTRWSSFLLTSTVTTLNYSSHWFRLHWNVSLCLSSWGMFHTDPKPAACGSSWLLHVEERSAPSYPAEEMLKYISLKYSMVIVSFGCPRSCFGNHRMV